MKITQAQKNELEKIAPKYGITLILLFGSQAKETAHPASDVDFGIMSEKQLSREQYAGLISDFARIFHIPSDRVDLTELKRADPLLLQRSYFEGILLYGKDELFRRRKMYALKRFMDHKKFFILQDRYIKQKLYGQS